MTITASDADVATRRRWWAVGAISTGTFLVVMDQLAVNVALPSVETHFRTDIPTVQWVFLAYALATSVCILPAGRLGDLLNRRVIYLAGFGIFAFFAAVSAASTSLPMLISAKVLQGVGSAMVQANGVAMMLSYFPGTERGQVLGLNILVVGVGAVAGPVIGGVVVGAGGWQAVFWVTAIGGTFVALLTALIVRGVPGELSQSLRNLKYDWTGAALSGLTLLVFLLVMNRGSRLGWTSPVILAGAASAAVLAIAFIRWERRTVRPMLDLSLFKLRTFALGFSAAWISFMGNGAVIFMVPFYLQKVLGYTPSQAGLAVAPNFIALAITGALSGRFSDKYGQRLFMITGLACHGTALLCLSLFMTSNSSLVLVIPLLMLSSSGMGLFSTPNQSAMMGDVDRSRYGLVTALIQLTRNGANITTIALTTTIVVTVMSTRGFPPSLEVVSSARGEPIGDAFVAGLRIAYLLMGILTAAAAAVLVFLGKPKHVQAKRNTAIPRTG